MSQQNVEIVKRAMDAFNRRDLTVYDDLYTADYEWFPALMGAVDGTSFRGVDGVRRYYEVLGDTWEEFRVETEELVDLGACVLAYIRVDGRGKGSGVPVVGRQTLICDIRDRKVSRVRSYLDRGDALKAAGMVE
jgi:ketosteroid isomerase-like protein